MGTSVGLEPARDSSRECAVSESIEPLGMVSNLHELRLLGEEGPYDRWPGFLPTVDWRSVNVDRDRDAAID